MSTIALPTPRASARLRRALVFGAATTAAAVLLGFVASNIYASLAQRDLRDRWERALAHPGARLQARPGDPVARIRLPAAGIDAVVVEGGGHGRRAPVHHAPTVLPGRPGLSAIEAGRLGFGSFFARIDRVAPGDEIDVQWIGGVTAYRVIDVRRMARTEIDFASNGDAALLMLIAPASRLGRGERIVVRAKAVTQ